MTTWMPRMMVLSAQEGEPEEGEIVETIRAKQLVVTSSPDWNKWPHTADTDFTELLDKRWESRYVHRGTEIIIENRLLPISFAHSAEGFAQKPPAHPHIDNTKRPADVVLQRQIELLREASEECDIILWDHAHQCYEPVAKWLPELFKLRILAFADDCPGSSEIKTFPVCRFFNSLYHCMKVWSFDGGQDVARMYRDRGVERTYFKASTESAGIAERAREIGFDLEKKLQAIEAGNGMPIDLVWVGFFAGNPWRANILGETYRMKPLPSLNVKYYGVNAPDGVLEPRVPPEGCGYTLAPVYAKSLFGINAQMSSLYNTRLIDLFMMGVAQLIYDPHQELRDQGFYPGAHYIAYDGTAINFWQQLSRWRAQPAKLAELIRNAHAMAVEHSRQNAVNKVYGRIYYEGLVKP